MKRTHLPWAFGLLGMFIAPVAIWSQNPGSKNNEPEVQTRGPVHDAMAQPFGVTPAPGPVVPNEPPPALAEDPPAQKPDMAGVQWIPGYWAWDAPSGQFLWISGVYRVPPPERNYIPGYWVSAQDGWRWVPGFWSSGKVQDTTYTPEPPAPLETGPAQPAPDANSLYIPGAWIWQSDRFAWRPGYWSAAQDGQVWTSPSYQWTPNGYAYIPGYWDYPLQNRGVMFAPVAFSQPLWKNPNWSYQPSYIVSPNSFLDSAFVNGPAFYFGNYYNPGLTGFSPWYTGRGRYDPLFAYNGLKNPGWLAGVQQTYARRSAGQVGAPPLTFAQQGGGNFISPFSQFGGGQLVTTTASQRGVQRTGIQQTRQLAVTRRQFEAGRNNQPAPIRLTGGAGANSVSGPRIYNGPASTGGDLPKIINQPRSFGPAAAGPKIVNGPAVTLKIGPPAAAQRVTPPVYRTVTAGSAPPARVSGAPAARPAPAAHAAAGHRH